MFSIVRPIRVFFALLPFVISFVRDWQRYILWGSPRVLTAEGHARRARRLTQTLGRLGPAFIKGAQVLATREDIIPKSYTRELKTLQDRVPPFPVEQVLAIIESECGRPAGEVFDSFDREPLAAASLGQVHRAIYKGRPVAVKILRPRVVETVETDLRVVSFLTHLVHTFIDSYLVRNFWEIHKEFRRMIRQEMDFRNEEANADRFRRNLAGDHRFLIPECARELTSRRMVVFDFVEGVRVDDPEGMRRCGLSTDDLIARLIEAYVRMTIIDGFVHADPHPGNLLVTPDGRVAVLDYGMALEFSDAVRLELLRACFAVVRKNLDTLVDCFYRLDMVEPDINRALVRDAAETLLRIQLREDFTPRMIQDIADDILATFHRFPLRMPQQLVFLFRASALVEGLGMQWDPHFSGVREATPVIKRLIRQVALAPERKWVESVLEEGRAAWATFRHLRMIVERFEREEQRVRLHPADVERFEGFLGAMTRRLLVGLGALGLGLVGLGAGMVRGKWLEAAAVAVPAGAVLLLAVLLPLKRHRRLR
jgi:predicted unusual protein kinase regulating ubiquinone biosynthesis (AarF/ABC1/UbiB family)